MKVININGKVVGKQDISMQSAPDVEELKARISNYIAKEMLAVSDMTSIEQLQRIFGTPACKVPYLSIYDFESNQRVDELLGLIAIAESTNKLANVRMIPAWQRPKQDDAMSAFTGKKSWDGFIYEHVSAKTYEPGIEVMPIPIEIKSLKIHPHKGKFSDLNDLLNRQVPKFAKHFQSEGSIAAVLVYPYSVSAEKEALRFDLKEAILTMNQHVANGVVGCLLFMDIITDKEGYTTLGIRCTFVNKKPNFTPNKTIDEVKMFEMKLIRFKK